MSNRPRLSELPPPLLGKTGWPWTVEPSAMPDFTPNGQPWPRVSIVSPSYNQWKYLEENIRSVLLQGYPDIEFIIHDGGSNNSVLEIFRKYDRWISYWVSEPDRGQSHAINKGILRSTGEIIFWLNSDDLLLPGAFQAVASAFITHPEVKLVSGQAQLIDSESKVIGHLKSYFTDWAEIATNPGNSLRQVSTFFKRELFEESGLLDENPHLAMDTDLLVRATAHHAPLVIDETLAAFRVHEEANTQTMLMRWYEENDRTRVKYLYTYKLRMKYKKRSSVHWLNLARADKWTIGQRKRSLVNAIRNRPSVIFSSEFWRIAPKLVITRK